ncbi:unnamed protein product [Calypogeia fissa]
METVVLPAQDHLAQERYRQQGGGLSGMIYPLGGLPRTRRKVARPPHHSDIARSSDTSNVQVADSRSVLVSPMDMSLGILRSAPSAAPASHLPPSSVLKTPQYRLTNTALHGFIPHESSSKKLHQHQPAASPSTQAVAGNSSSGAARLLLRTRSDGELLQQQGLKRGVEDRKKALEKGAESLKNSEKTFEKNTEKSFDRRRGLDRRPLEKNPITGTNGSHGVKSSNVQKKAGVITILQRPQTKEAAVENIALFAGRPIKDVTKQNLKSVQVVPHPSAQHVEVEVELVENAEFSGKDGEFANVYSKTSRNTSPKKGTKKKPSHDISGNAASRAAAAEGVQAEPRRSQGLYRGLSDSAIGETAQAFARQGIISQSASVQDASHCNDSSGELFLSPSSPPKLCERWAGPAYTNSPPPSTLPFPTFPLQRVKTSLTEVSLADVALRGPEDMNLENASNAFSSAPTSPTQVVSLLFSATVIQSPFVDPSSATKDLRRMLNLDVEDSFDVSAEWSRGGVESPTQSLKRILQLV